ncbi:MAG: YbgC/FadM family acyl-CoA thioesterase [Gammaproteobacteria bacterium]|nr:YbgC/FadM family acyl-CoA thioesterase [Gammaproteobacteria bacterium]
MNNATHARTVDADAARRRFTVTMTVDYADTDAGGVVYYANYLACMERARNAWLRALGFPLNKLARRHHVLFTVVDAHLNYHAPGYLDDALAVSVEVMRLQRASIRFRQTVQRGDDAGDGDGHGDGNNGGDGGNGKRHGDTLLVNAEIRLGLVNSDTFKPCRMPAELVDAINRWSRLNIDAGDAGDAGESTGTVTVANPMQTPPPPTEQFHAD